MTVANLLTIGRIFVGPIFLILYLQSEWLGISPLALPLILIGLLALSELSDLLDGAVARKMGQVSDLGKILDPMADSISRISVFLTFTQGPVGLPLLLVFVFLYRDSMIGTLRTICALNGFALAARPSGKIKAVVLATAAFLILALMIPEAVGAISQKSLRVASIWITSIAALYTALSAVEYLIANRGYLQKVMAAKDRFPNGGTAHG